MTAIQLKHGPFASETPKFWPNGPAYLQTSDAESRIGLVKKSTDADWLTAVIRDRDVQSTVRLAAERRLRKVNDQAERQTPGE